MMTGFAREEPAVERDEGRVVERLREERHPLAAPRLDQREAEERVDQPSGLLGADGGHQAGGVGARDEAPEAETTRREVAEHLLEVTELLPRQAGERHEQAR